MSTTAYPTAYPVHLDARLETDLSRWRWLVKWLLLIPHYIVLAFLWLAFAVCSLFAFFAILVTGRYPRAIFEFNVGVLRWSWRVSYYSYGALGTDRYPPFSLEERPDYPTHLAVDYPERLSRGLVLVKWWLLAIPHYIVIGFFVGGASYTVSELDGGNGDPVLSTGLIGVLVLVASVVLLVTGTYPRSVFDLLLGLNRWVLRVAAYAGLMTDRYPPFRLDMGGDDPDGHLVLNPPRPDVPAQAGPSEPTRSDAPPPPLPPMEARPATPPATPPKSSGWGVGRVIALVLGCLLLFSGLATGAAALAMSVTNEVARDQDGFLMTPAKTLDTSTYAISSDRMELSADEGVPNWAPESLFGDGRVVADPQGDHDLFVGVAPSSDVSAWFGDTSRVVVDDLTGVVRYRAEGSGKLDGLPADQSFWVASQQGPGRQSVTWPLSNGDWTVVVMNADGASGVNARVRAGATLPVFGWATAALWWTTAGLVLVGAVIVVLAVATRRTTTGPSALSG
jgi:uncharacterized protein DUF4389